MRPRQWVKNLLVLSAPLAAAEIGEERVLAPVLIVGAAFCAASSAVYLFNDVQDRESDRQHPDKRFRPIASGQVGVGTALALSVVLAVVAIGAAWSVNGASAGLVGGYLAMQVGYCLWLKHEPVLDLATIALGFLIRAVAGGAAADIVVTTPFLLVAGFGSLFIVAGKRYSELMSVGANAATRQSLVRYSDTFLRFVWTLGASVTVLTYAMWALEQDGGGSLPWHAISVAPFVIGLLSYAVDVDGGRAGAPEEIVWRDRRLQAVGIVWLAIVCLGIFGV